MSSSNKKTKVSRFLNYDCLGTVLSFLSSRDDFLSLILTFKGFWMYLKAIYPRGASNILFSAKTLPWNDFEHVHKLSYGRIRGISNLERKTKQLYGIDECHSAEDIFYDLSSRFPNLHEISFHIIHRLHSKLNKVNMWNLKTVVLSNQTEYPLYCSNLKKLTLILSKCDLVIRHRFPKLQEATISRLGHYKGGGAYSAALGDHPNTMNTLEVDWKLIPSLRKLHLYGWKLLSPLHEITENIEEISLSLLIPQSPVIENIKNLKILVLSAIGDGFVTTVQNLPDLKELNIRNEHLFGNNDNDNNGSIFEYDSLELGDGSFFLQNLPVLEEVKFDGIYGEGNTFTIHGKEFPNLKRFFSFGDEMPYFLFTETETLERVYIEGDGFGLMDDRDGRSLTKIGVTDSPEYEAILSRIPTFKKLRSLKFRSEYRFENITNPNEFIDIQNLGDLEKIECLDYEFCISSVKYCSNLKKMEIRPNEDIKVSNLPHLEIMVLYIHFSEEEVNNRSLHNVLEQIYPENKMKKLTYLRIIWKESWCLTIDASKIKKSVSKLFLDGTRKLSIAGSSSFRTLCISEARQVEIEGVQNMEVLILSFYEFSKFSVKNCNDLKVIRLMDFERENGASCLKTEKSCIELQNLICCNEIGFGNNFNGVDVLSVQNCPIKNICVHLNSMGLRIESSSFPLLEEISFFGDYTEMNQSEKEKRGIELISSIKTLKHILLSGDLCDFRRTFVKRVEGLLLWNIVVVSRKVFKEIGKGFRLPEYLKGIPPEIGELLLKNGMTTLQLYIEDLRKKGVKIFAE